ncbi:hypothetical protein [Levilactobacillus brevis]|uniref:hypothetical protein n=1 Tax=Levilactobacillus brevis TaxID=1580 RepID=UPI000B3EAB25|nr:hypothetical protein [Levilactobacillus brevis]ARW23058.1 hypothetical protein S101174_02251 [Levilactobacillus brevis]
MTTFELEEYLEANSQIVDNFRDKYAAFLNKQNADRPTNKKWSSLRIKNETSSTVIKFISNIQAKLSSAMKPRQRKQYAAWIDYIERNEIIDNLEESLMDLEFA